MTLSQVRDTYSWQGATDLGPKLLSLADELPASEEFGLGLLIRQLAVELPASIAAHLLRGENAPIGKALRLASAIELIDRVYPALDTADSRRSVEALVERMVSDKFAEQRGNAGAAPARVTVKPAAPAAEEAAEAAPEPPRTVVKLTPESESEETHVHPDSQQ